MKYVEIVARDSSLEMLLKVADRAKSEDIRLGADNPDGLRTLRLLVHESRLQQLLDDLQLLLGAQQASRIIVLPVETLLPEPAETDQARDDAATAARESLFDEVQRNVRLNANFVVLVCLSTLVAAIGMIENNVAVIIGGMVIAPLLGPNLALSLGTALGNGALIRQSSLALLVGMLLPILLGCIIALVWPGPESLQNAALNARTESGISAVLLALASGAAAALSLTTGLSSILVGVMVAVALLPPATAMGLMLGQGEWTKAVGAGLLLTIDVVCINLAAKTVFLLKGVRPRSGEDKQRAQRSMAVYMLAWIITLAALIAASLTYQHLSF